ncbi:hypothetical protein D1872_296320 [compost metagenome]
MPDNIILLQIRNHAVHQMQIRATDRCAGHFDNHIVRLLNSRIRHVLHYDIFNPLIGYGFHA